MVMEVLVAYGYDDVDAVLVVFWGYGVCLGGVIDLFGVGAGGVFAFVGVAGYVFGLV